MEIFTTLWLRPRNSWTLQCLILVQILQLSPFIFFSHVWFPQIHVATVYTNCSQIQAQTDLGSQAHLDRHIYNFTTPPPLGINSYTQNLEASLHSQASVLLFSISFTTNKNWILTPNFQCFPPPTCTRKILDLWYRWGLYLFPSSYLVPHLIS